jgi:hypothetical protein
VHYILSWAWNVQDVLRHYRYSGRHTHEYFLMILCITLGLLYLHINYLKYDVKFTYYVGVKFIFLCMALGLLSYYLMYGVTFDVCSCRVPQSRGMLLGNTE